MSNGDLLAACVLGCSLFQFTYHKYGQASAIEYFFVFHIAVLGFTLLYASLGGGSSITIGGLVIYALTCLLFWIIKNLDAQNALDRRQAANEFGKAATSEDETAPTRS